MEEYSINLDVDFVEDLFEKHEETSRWIGTQVITDGSYDDRQSIWVDKEEEIG